MLTCPIEASEQVAAQAFDIFGEFQTAAPACGILVYGR